MLHSFIASSLTIPFYYPTSPMYLFLLLISIFFFNNDRRGDEKELNSSSLYDQIILYDAYSHLFLSIYLSMI
jgi:hypothetical protein